ncbi:unnamed protein product [Cuscuta campestris]|uniref:THUMP domain-containing protein n=2 Tax=Cuscuta sect. Cleistogrammica TaxID=1824901 RepID=A0A484NPS8_9ASTE|nr:hypothetical protein DM860_009902 [Cuscuta australis]VFR02943.1 unnamed protein product [Cuscuta campestris]
MASENNSKANKKNRQRYLPHNKPVKKGSYPLRPGVQGFYITCDGGKEREASHEALDVLDSFYEELQPGTKSKDEDKNAPKQLLNKKTVFTYSDSSSSDEEDEEGNEGKENGQDQKDANNNTQKSEDQQEKVEGIENGEQTESHENETDEVEEPPAKKQCVETVKAESSSTSASNKVEQSVDRRIEAELAELADKSKRRFSYLDSGCNGVVFVQMRVRDGDPSPREIVHHMVSSLASTKKHVSRFMLRLLPIEAACYTSDEEIKKAIKPLIEKYFPSETQNPLKFAVLYEARANSGINRSKIIDTVAKSVPQPHKVDLTNPDLHIVVQIVKTVCLIGVVEKYKEFAKYNIRQLTSSK